MNKITSLRAQILYQRELGNQKLADILVDDLNQALEKIPECWRSEENNGE